jgi:hypothetical protein
MAVPAVAGGRLDEELLHVGAGDDALVELDVQRAAAGEGQLAGLAQDVAEVVVDHLQGRSSNSFCMLAA